jgi:hypothetical protein
LAISSHAWPSLTGQGLDGDIATELAIVRLIHLAHAASA